MPRQNLNQSHQPAYNLRSKAAANTLDGHHFGEDGNPLQSSSTYERVVKPTGGSRDERGPDRLVDRDERGRRPLATTQHQRAAMVNNYF